ncbi:response regulator [Nonomuraea jabiensis]|uniref:response regulator n=1 Tax=Nonomuraea jabiensis TaxID=882448 RepID=UPI003685D715
MARRHDCGNSRVTSRAFVTCYPEALGLNGFLMRTVADGRQALEAVARERPDIIVLDVMMPGPDGFTVARRLREAGTAR